LSWRVQQTLNLYSWWRHNCANIIILLVYVCYESSKLGYYFLILFVFIFISSSLKLSHYTDYKAILWWFIMNSIKCNERLHCCICFSLLLIYIYLLFMKIKSLLFLSSMFFFFVANNDVINYRSRMLLYQNCDENKIFAYSFLIRFHNFL